MVHLDDTTPHLHLGLVPITKDNRLCSKEIFTRKELTNIQKVFAAEVGAKYGLERGKRFHGTHLYEIEFKVKCEMDKLRRKERKIDRKQREIQWEQKR